MKTVQSNILKWLFGLATAFSLLITVVMPFTQGEATNLEDFAASIAFLGLTLGLFGCYLIIVANDPITVVNKISVMVLWVMGNSISAFFLTYVFTDSPAEREYLFGAICGLPGLFMSIMGIILYQHELKQKQQHPFDSTDPMAQIESLKEDEPSLVPTRMGLLLAALFLVIIVFDIWVAIFEPFS